MPTDDELLRSGEPEAFGVFYDRHAEAVLGWFEPRTFEPEEAADLTAATFAAALAARHRFQAAREPAADWLSAIAARRLAAYQRRGRVGERDRRALGMPRRRATGADEPSATTLRQDLVDAAAREQRRSAPSRAARRLHPRAWSGGAALAAVVAVAGLVAVPLGLRADPRSRGGEIVRAVALGGQPRAALAAGGRLVVADEQGAVAAIDPARPSSRTDLRVGGIPLSLAAARAGTWVVSQRPTIPRGTHLAERTGPALTHLVRLDARTGRVIARVPVRDVADAMRAGASGVRLPAYLGRVSHLEGLPAPGLRIPVRVEEELVLGDRSAWVRRGDAVYEFDAGGRLVGRARGISPPPTLTERQSMLPDADGAWVVGSTNGVLYRVERGRVTRRVGVGDAAGVAARAGAGVWVSATSRPGSFELVRVEGAAVTRRVALGGAEPEAIAPAGERVWVVTSGGEALLVNPG